MLTCGTPRALRDQKLSISQLCGCQGAYALKDESLHLAVELAAVRH